LCPIEKLDEVLKKDKDSKRGDQVNQVRSILSPEGVVDKSIYTEAQDRCKGCGKKKEGRKCKPREMASV
jgi:hypothetical protein